MSQMMLLGVGGGGAAPPAGPITDDFNRASLGSGWADVIGTWGITSDTAKPTSQVNDQALMSRTEAAFPNDQYAQVYTEVPVGVSGGGGGVAVRVQGEQDYYAAFLFSNGSVINYIELYKRVANAWIWKADISVSGALGTMHLLKMDATGTTLTVYFNSTQVYQATDTGVASGKPGLFQFGTAGCREDDFECTAAS